MLLYQNSHIRIYFGDRSDQLHMTPQTYDNFSMIPNILDMQPFTHVREKLNISTINFARQVHGTHILDITKETISTARSFASHGDALVTQELSVGLGVLTADCLPIILHDTHTYTIAIIHAGWKGTINLIASKVVNYMITRYKTNPKNLVVYFGPGAGPCCYNVGNQVTDMLGDFKQETTSIRDGLTYFDNRLFNQLSLQQCGIPKDSFNSDFALCTICNDQFWSYRRQPDTAGRQMTVVSLQ